MTNRKNESKNDSRDGANEQEPVHDTLTTNKQNGAN